MNRPEHALQLRVSLLEALCPRGPFCHLCCASVELEQLEVDHVDGCTWYGRELNFLDRIRARERASLSDAVLELAYGGTELQILARVREDWGPCTIGQVRRAIADLTGDGELVRDGAGWVRK